MRKLAIPFRIAPSRVSEKSAETDPRRLVMELARRKALAVSGQYPESCVLGADTVVVMGRRIIGKPKNRNDSRRMIQALNGRVHFVYTGTALALPGGRTVFKTAAKTRLKSRRLTRASLNALAGKHMDKAGSYAVQDRKDPLIEAVYGPLDTVIGLHLASVQSLLKKAARAGVMTRRRPAK